jgi:hypothetical protein
MKTKLHFLTRSLFAALALLLILATQAAYGQGTAFTYQGRLNIGTNPATGLYDFQFSAYNSPVAGALLAGPTTLLAVPVTNGLFAVQVDLGTVFTGGFDWLQITVRSNGVGGYIPLAPRNQVTPTPYAIYAEGGNAAGLTGTVPAGDLSGTYNGALTLNNAGNAFTGNGSSLTGLNASQLATGIVPNARLAPDVAFTDSNQTFTAVNTFLSGTNTGKFIVSNNGFYGNVDTNAFTGMSLQYDGNYGEGAIISSYATGEGYLSFYTKANAHPVTKQMSIDFYGNVAIGLANQNDGALNNNSYAGAGLTFGAGSGEGIASKRTAGGNQNGLDFYTGFANRLSIDNTGDLLFNDPSETIVFPATAGANSPMIEMFSSGTANADRMVIAHSPPFPNYGLQYQDVGDRFNFLGGGFPVLTVNLSSHTVGIGGATNPAATLEVNGDAKVDSKMEVNGDLRIDAHRFLLYSGSDTNSGIGAGNFVPGFGIFNGSGPMLFGYDGGCLGAIAPNIVCLSWDFSGNVWVSNNCSVGTLTIRGGADLAEPFNISTSQGGVSEGAVVVIDEQNPGHLKLSDSAYDTHVAGIISGANGVNPGIQMHQQGIIEGGRNVALTGRVYVQADTSNGAIKPGDMLTTSGIPGHAMKVTDHSRAAGAILGKAMTGLSKGDGMVLVLVTLQ